MARRHGVVVLGGVGDDELPGIGPVPLDLLPRWAAPEAAASVVTPALPQFNKSHQLISDLIIV